MVVTRVGLVFFVAVAGCQRTPDVPVPTPYVVSLPPEIAPMPVPGDNPMTVEGVSLGRFLFYDPIVSGNDRQSCSTCHLQGRGFTDGKAVSIGAQGEPVRRNAMALVNLAWTAPYFWDGRAATLEELVPIPIRDPTEMNQDIDALLAELREHPQYPGRFERAFPGEGITATTLAKAVAQFLRTLVSFDSKMDRLHRNAYEPNALEKRGAELMQVGLPKGSPAARADFCNVCHEHQRGLRPMEKPRGMGMFTLGAARNNGFALGDDLGRYEVSARAEDRGTFDVPTIRNLSVTGPYMHDGRLATLREVVRHYDRGVVASETLAPELTLDGRPVRLNLTDDEVDAVVATLEMFTDASFLTNPAFSDPFAEAPSQLDR